MTALFLGRNVKHGDPVHGSVTGSVLKWSTTTPRDGKKSKGGYIGSVGLAMIDAEKCAQTAKVDAAFKSIREVGMTAQSVAEAMQKMAGALKAERS